MLKKEKGFTLIELLVVISIMGVITTLALISIGQARTSSRDARRKSDLELIRAAFELYRSDCGRYPATLPAIGSPLVGENATGNCLTTNTYMSARPGDPRSERFYSYLPGGTRLTYDLCTALETVTTGNPSPCAASGNCGSSVTCNYQMSNP